MQEYRREFRPHTQYFARRQLEAIRHVRDVPLCVVEAPVGYGKTTLVKAYLHTNGIPYGWQSIYEPSTEDFWQGFCQMIATVDAKTARRLREIGFPQDSAGRFATLHALQRMEHAPGLVLVLDDFQQVERQQICKLVDFWIGQPLGGLHFVVITRNALGAYMEQWKLRESVLYIGKDDLALREEEIAAYMSACGVVIDKAVAHRLYRQTEGWISALYLMQLTYRKEGVWEPAQDIFGFIEKTVVQDLSPQQKHVLYTMCYFDGFSAEQANFIVDDPGAGAVLETLAQHNAFVRFYIKEQRYHIHALLGAYLRHRAAQIDPQAQRRVYARAAQWHLRNKEIGYAARYYLLAKEYDAVMALVEMDIPHERCDADGHRKLLQLLDQCPLQVQQRHPRAMMRLAFGLFVYGEMERFEALCRRIFQQIQRADATRSPQEHRQLMGEWLFLHAYGQFNDMEGMEAERNRARKWLSAPPRFLHTASMWTFGAFSALEIYHRTPGRLEEEIQRARNLFTHDAGQLYGYGAGAASLLEADARLQQLKLEQAEILAHKASYQAQQREKHCIVQCALFVLARIALLRGERGQIAPLMHQMRGLIGRGNAASASMVDLCKAYLYGCLGSPEQMPDWIASGEGRERLLFIARGGYDIVYARSLYLSGQYAKLIGVVPQMIRAMHRGGRALTQLHLYLELALANEKMGRREQAQEAARCAMVLATADGLWLPIVERGKDMAALLSRVYRDGSRDWLIAQCNGFAERVGCMRRRALMTQREREVIALVQKGLTNKQIGQALYISENTVKTQLKKIFAKLGIHSRSVLMQMEADQFI